MHDWRDSPVGQPPRRQTMRIGIPAWSTTALILLLSPPREHRGRYPAPVLPPAPLHPAPWADIHPTFSAAEPDRFPSTTGR